MKNLELLIQPLDHKLNDFDKEKQNFYEKYEIKIMTEQDLMFILIGFGQTWNPMNPPANASKREHQLCRRISPEILKQRLKVNNKRFKVYKKKSTDNTRFT